jgi:hypothetical protein
MKKLSFLIVFCAGSMLVFAQDHRRGNWNVPPTVEKSYHKDYPGSDNSNNSWDMKNNQWHTRYMDKDHNRNVDVYYDRNGRRMQTQSEWTWNDLPKRAQDRVRSRYHNRHNNYNVSRIEKPGRTAFFQISWGNTKIYVDANGRSVKY